MSSQTTRGHAVPTRGRAVNAGAETFAVEAASQGRVAVLSYSPESVDKWPKISDLGVL